MTGRQQKSTGFRVWLIILGITLFFWSGKEDNDVAGVTTLGLVLAGTCVWWYLIVRPRPGVTAAIYDTVLRALLGGALLGALSSLFTALLMLLKDIRHGHVFPDYPPELILATLDRLPAWSLAGGLAGIALILLFKAFLGAGAGGQ